MISFDNTAIAFASRTDRDLLRSYWLFKLVSNPSLVKMGKVATDFALKYHLPVKSAIKATIFKQFCGGETIEECDRVIKDLASSGIGTILDYSVEGKVSEKDFDHTTEETIRTIIRAKGDKNIPFSVFKVTGLGSFSILEKANDGKLLSGTDKDQMDKIYHRVERICRMAFENDTPVFIDAEESWIQNTIDRLADDMMFKFNKEKPIVYNTFQLYRHDRLEFLKSSFEKSRTGQYFLGAKLVRGAYMEKERSRAEAKGYPNPIQPDKESTDRDYDRALEFCIKHIDSIGFCAGTHNEKSSLYLSELVTKNKIKKDHPNIYFSQLLGMSDHIRYNIAYEGFNVAKYVPYGPVHEVVPYLIRRAQENTSVKGQTGRELGLIIKERRRRSSK